MREKILAPRASLFEFSSMERFNNNIRRLSKTLSSDSSFWRYISKKRALTIQALCSTTESWNLIFRFSPEHDNGSEKSTANAMAEQWRKLVNSIKNSNEISRSSMNAAALSDYDIEL